MLLSITLALSLGESPVGSTGQAELGAARDRLLAWYEQNLAQLDAADAFPVAPADALRSADLDRLPGLRFAAGPRAAGGAAGYRWRPLALWLAARAGDTSGFDASGHFTADPQVRYFAVFASEALQRDAYAASERKLRTLATLAELRFVAKLRADPDHDLNRNWFRAADCEHVGDEVPCTSAGTPLPIAELMATSDQLGAAFRRPVDLDPAEQPDALAVNAWGGPNWFDNSGIEATAAPATNAAAPLQPPFSMRFLTTTPFATRIEVDAVQPAD